MKKEKRERKRGRPPAKGKRKRDAGESCDDDGEDEERMSWGDAIKEFSMELQDLGGGKFSLGGELLTVNTSGGRAERAARRGTGN